MLKIKQLREATGAGIIDCKNALKQSGDNVEKAI
ncbi:MAG: elongation factor Ts, partial [Patescibacteria group bacterium]